MESRESEVLIVAALSDVVDIFTVLPPSSEAARPQSRDEPTTKLEVRRPQELAYKSIRKSRAGPIVSAVNGDAPDWKAARKIMG